MSEETKDTNLDREEEEQVDEFKEVATTVIFEAIRRDGKYELRRPVSALWWSGVVAGVAISMSLVSKGVFVSVLPDEAWASSVSNIGYTIGFLIVILGRMQLFTENTITPILPLLLDPTRDIFFRTARLWGVVLAANLVGCAASALVLAHGTILPEPRLDGIITVARHYGEKSALQHFGWGVPAGFIIAALVWTLPRVEGAGEVLMIMVLTYVIGLGGMSHVVAGATELFLLVALGEMAPGAALVGGVLPALAGNVLGGTGIFAALTYAQVRNEV
ncbi:MAG: formate/nitrite transporter family protein [Roseovarius sp.]